MKRCQVRALRRIPSAAAAGLAAVLVLVGPAWASTDIAAGGQGFYGTVTIAPEAGSGRLSWALPVTLSGLLKLAQVDALSTEDLQALLKKGGLRDLAKGLPQTWDDATLKAMTAPRQAGNEQGYVLVASWHTDEPQEKWGDGTQFWLEAKLRKGEEVVFDTTPPPHKSYALKDYDAAVRDLAEMVVQNVNPGAAAKAKESEAWTQKITLDQIRLLAEAEQMVAAGNLEGARTKLGQAATSVTGQEGSLLARLRLMEVNEAVRLLDPERAKEIGRQGVDEAAEARDDKLAAWDRLWNGDCYRLQERWDLAAGKYFFWVQWLVDQKLMQADEVFPEELRKDLTVRKPSIWAKLAGHPGAEAEWWATAALAVYRGASGELAAPLAKRAEDCANREPNESTRADALGTLASQAGLRSDLDGEERLYKAALGIQERLEPGSLDWAWDCNCIGVVHAQEGDVKGAQEWFKKALVIYERLAPGSLYCAHVYRNLGATYIGEDELEQASALYQKALAIQERLEPGSPFCAATYATLGLLSVQNGDPTTALAWCEKALVILERMAPGSLDCGLTYGCVGLAYTRKGDMDRGLVWCQKALAIEERLAPGSMACALTYSCAGLACSRKGDLDRALMWCQKALAIEERLAPGSMACAGTYACLGSACARKGDLDRALEWYQKALAVYERMEPGSCDCAGTYDDLGVLFANKGDLDQALEWLQKAVDSYERLAPASPACADTCRDLGDVYKKKGDMAQAQKWYDKADAIEKAGKR